MGIIIIPFLVVIRTMCDLIYFLVIMYSIIETLIAFEILTINSRRMYLFRNSLCYVVEPMLCPIRKMIPSFRYFDISPLVLLLIILFLRVMASELLGMF